ncbi:hypothetical protein ACLPJF_13565 [Pseudomonas vlassakiae]|uniref:hypothetical protein n=1 Tax=Pseudomonas vlassakiae TaxID=485888 RepID=UPI003D26DEA4
MSDSSPCSKCVSHIQLIERATRLSLDDCVALQLPADTPNEECKAFAEALERGLDKRLLLILGDNIQGLDEAAMNAAGWYRK